MLRLRLAADHRVESYVASLMHVQVHSLGSLAFALR
jgi:hypothetical protein